MTLASLVGPEVVESADCECGLYSAPITIMIGSNDADSPDHNLMLESNSNHPAFASWKSSAARFSRLILACLSFSLTIGLWLGAPLSLAQELPAKANDSAAPSNFVGSDRCAQCHTAEHKDWLSSQHAVAMQEATEQTVLGRFDGVTFSKDDVTSTFYKKDGKFWVRTDGPDGALGDFQIRYTFGIWPLQQYLIELPGGRIQALGIAWDARSKEEGGQRWYHLYPDHKLKAGDPLHWTGIDQNWNYQCAWCHSTNLKKNYDQVSRRFSTTWSEISVGCEACHGPGSGQINAGFKTSSAICPHLRSSMARTLLGLNGWPRSLT